MQIQSTFTRQLVPLCAVERRVEVDGVSIRYLAAGQGAPLLLVHGLLGYSFSWSENFAALAEHFTVLAVDLPNMGLSGRANTDASLQGHARWLAAFLDALKIDQTDMIASSHGGTVAMQFGVLHPERVQRMLLVSPANPFSEKQRWMVELFTSWPGKWAAYLVPWMQMHFRRLWLRRIYYRPKNALPGTVEGYTAPLRIRGTIPHVLRLLSTWFVDIRGLRGELEKLKALDIHFIWGQEDKVVPLDSGEELSKFLGKPLAVIPDCAHLPYEEKPQEFNRVVMEILVHSS